MNWVTIEAALHAWITAASGLSTVVWSGQKSPRPTSAWISLQLLSVREVGADWVDVLDAAVPAPGAEIEHRARGMRECTLSVQCFGGAAGVNSATARLEAVRSAARLPTRQAALTAAGVGLSSFGPVQSIGGMLGSSVFEPRATLQIVFYATSEVVELGTFIEFVEVESLDSGESIYVPENPSP